MLLARGFYNLSFFELDTQSQEWKPAFQMGNSRLETWRYFDTLDISGSIAIVSFPALGGDRQGQVFIFEKSGSDWNDPILKHPDWTATDTDFFGSGVSILNETAMMNAPGEHGVYLFKKFPDADNP